MQQSFCLLTNRPRMGAPIQIFPVIWGVKVCLATKLMDAFVLKERLLLLLNVCSNSKAQVRHATSRNSSSPAVQRACSNACLLCRLWKAIWLNAVPVFLLTTVHSPEMFMVTTGVVWRALWWVCLRWVIFASLTGWMGIIYIDLAVWGSIPVCILSLNHTFSVQSVGVR